MKKTLQKYQLCIYVEELDVNWHLHCGSIQQGSLAGGPGVIDAVRENCVLYPSNFQIKNWFMRSSSVWHHLL